ncbi:high mobility group B protein 13-like [Silene latifolia]|uniref:high mobility group B protein 13-like n=1 Tax=Silene latifolia TaxID=37657 RepID=UPI003D779FC9
MSSSVATSDLPVPVATKKGRSKKALKDKKSSTSEANILAGNQSTDALEQVPVPVLVPEPEKENNLEVSGKKKKSKSKAKAKGKEQEEVVEKVSDGNGGDFEKQLQEMQEMMEKMKIEKEKTEEMLKEKDEILKKKDEEIKKLHKIKEFKPTMTLPIMQSMKGKEIEKQDKKKKDCPERKRPASAYALWCKDVYSEIKKENPEAAFKEMSNLLSVKWKSLTPEEKKLYEEQYQAEKEAYLKVMSKEKRESEAMKLLEDEHKQKSAMELLDQYLQFVQEADKGTKKSKKEKDPSKPKQPVGAFFLYSNERRSALLGEGKKLLEASKIAGEEWKNMTAEQKRPYEEVAKVNKEKYQEEMELYKQKKEEETASLKKEEEELMKIHKVEALQLLKKKEKTENIIKQTKDLKKKQKEEKVVDPNKPKRPTSSFFLFSKEERKNLLKEKPDINSSTIPALISLKWKELSEEEKKIWNDKAAEGMEAYKKELEEYNKQQAEAGPV